MIATCFFGSLLVLSPTRQAAESANSSSVVSQRMGAVGAKGAVEMGSAWIRISSPEFPEQPRYFFQFANIRWCRGVFGGFVISLA